MQTSQSSSYRAVLTNQGFPAFLWMQFLNAFNDNVYKLVVSLLAVLAASHSHSSGTYLSLAGFIFVAPYLLFSAYAGQLADMHEKRTVVIATKAIEIAAMAMALFALVSGSIPWMLLVLFFTATQAAFFSPAKYGIVPELVPEQHLARANGLLEMSTFVAIILGTVAGTRLVAMWGNEPAYIGLTLIAVAIAGTWASLRIRRTPAPIAHGPFSWNPFGDALVGMKRISRDHALAQAVFGTTYFWFLGALFQMLLLLFGKEALHCPETQIGVLLASLAIGIGVGSMAAGRLSGDHVEAGLVPVGAFGMAAAALCVSCAHTVLWASIALAALGFAGGLFIVPLNAILQHRPEQNEKGRILATANLVNTIGIMAASGLVWLLHEALQLSAARVIALSALLTFGAGVIALALVPKITVRFVLFVITRCIYRIRVAGQENIPQKGPALLVANHVSYVDGFLIGACIHSIVRFLVDHVWFSRFRAIFELFDAIPVPSGNRRAVLKSIESAREALEQGDIVCIFAEGTLTVDGNLGEFHRGLERIVDGLEIPVIPVHLGGVWGSVFSLDRGASLWRSLRKLPFPISVSFGKAMREPGAFEVRQAVAELGADAALSADEKRTVAREFFASAKKYWSQPAMTELSGRTLTYGEALTGGLLFAGALDRKCENERMIGVMLPACTGAALANLATVLSGRTVVNLNFTSGPAALDSAIEQSGLRTIITSKQFLAKAKLETKPNMVFLEDLLQFGRVAKAFAYGRARLLPVGILSPRRVKAGDLAAILFSSGSTGTPKGVMLSHRNLVSNVESVGQLFPLGKGQAIAGVLPFFHAFGFTYTLWFPLLNGATAAYHAQPLDAKGVGELVRKTGATVLPAPPTFCQAYVRGCSAEQFASLRYVLVGAERLSSTLAQSFAEKFGVPLLEGYGATEMSPVISVNVPDAERAGMKRVGFRSGTVGRPIPNVTAKVVDPETGEDRKPGEEGLLLVKGPNRMMGYLNRPAESAAVLRDGWYVTGDIVSMDALGFIKIVDRQSRFSKIAGEMVPHGTVEEALYGLLPGSRCAVTSVADERRENAWSPLFQRSRRAVRTFGRS